MKVAGGHVHSSQGNPWPPPLNDGQPCKLIQTNSTEPDVELFMMARPMKSSTFGLGLCHRTCTGEKDFQTMSE